MSLHRLAIELIQRSRSGQQTSVLVTPHEFSLRPSFFIALINAIADGDLSLPATNLVLDRGLDIDYYQEVRGPASFLADLRSRRRARAIGRELQKAMRQSEIAIPVQVHWTSMIRRPTQTGPIVIGCCDERQSLPGWAAPFRLATTQNYQ